MNTFFACLAAYLTGWVIVQLLWTKCGFRRLLDDDDMRRRVARYIAEELMQASGHTFSLNNLPRHEPHVTIDPRHLEES